MSTGKDSKEKPKKEKEKKNPKIVALDFFAARLEQAKKTMKKKKSN